jgi:hypothetical protein
VVSGDFTSRRAIRLAALRGRFLLAGSLYFDGLFLGFVLQYTTLRSGQSFPTLQQAMRARMQARPATDQLLIRLSSLYVSRLKGPKIFNPIRGSVAPDVSLGVIQHLGEGSEISALWGGAR